MLRPKGRGLSRAQRLRQFGDELEQLHGPSGFPAPFSEPQFGGVAPAKRPNVSGYINQEREVNGMVSARPLRRTPDVLKRLALHVCEILRSLRSSLLRSRGSGSSSITRRCQAACRHYER